MVAARDGRTVYVTNFQGASVSVVDTRSWTKTKDIAVPDRPFDAVLSPDGRFVYVACYGGSAVAVIDAASASLAGTIALPQGTQPYGIAISPDGRYVYASDNANGQLLVLDANARSYLRAVPIGAKPALIARSPDGATLYVANGQAHSVSILDIGKDAAQPALRASVDVGGGYPHGIAVTPDGRYAVVATTFGKHLAVIDTATQRVVATAAAEQDPNDVLITA
jgi:YVTN family beta-propeller protein